MGCAGFNEHGCGGLIDGSGLSGGEIYVESNAGDNAFLVGGGMFNVFRENAADLFSMNEEVVGPFGLSGDAAGA